MGSLQTKNRYPAEIAARSLLIDQKLFLALRQCLSELAAIRIFSSAPTTDALNGDRWRSVAIGTATTSMRREVLLPLIAQRVFSILGNDGYPGFLGEGADFVLPIGRPLTVGSLYDGLLDECWNRSRNRDRFDGNPDFTKEVFLSLVARRFESEIREADVCEWRALSAPSIVSGLCLATGASTKFNVNSQLFKFFSSVIGRACEHQVVIHGRVRFGDPFVFSVDSATSVETLIGDFLSHYGIVVRERAWAWDARGRVSVPEWDDLDEPSAFSIEVADLLGFEGGVLLSFDDRVRRAAPGMAPLAWIDAQIVLDAMQRLVFGRIPQSQECSLTSGGGDITPGIFQLIERERSES